jgi:hypothetical protein
MKKLKTVLSLFILALIVISCGQVTKPAADKKNSAAPEAGKKPGLDFPIPAVPPGLRISTFDVDATPPVGTQIAYDSVLNTWDLGQRAKGVVIMGAGQPVILCSIDWVCISNEGNDAFRQALADAAGTIPSRVAVHTVHQHDSPWCDFTAEKILKDAKINPGCFEGSFARDVIQRLAVRVRKSMENSQPVTHIGVGEAKVNDVASNRRILGPDGKVRATRYTATADPALRAEPVGVIDPVVSILSFWNNDKPLAVLSYYACHPQSYYHTGLPNPDFPGIARFMRQLAVPDALHIHFDGAGGNIGAGKYNDGSHINRLILAERLADGMKRAWGATKKEAVTAESVGWKVEPVNLPLSGHMEKLKARLAVKPDTTVSIGLAIKLAWLNRINEGKKIELTCLSIGKARLLHLPGELFVEYQLAAKAERKDLFVAMAAYGDCGTGYVGTAIAYQQGGYETSPVSNVGPGSEAILMGAIHKLLSDKQ